jgi:hypothetical protein
MPPEDDMRFNLLAAALLATPLVWADPDLDRAVADLLPRPEEVAWLELPWRTNVLQARLDAQRESKPILFWIMDGNVLGCT